MAYNDGITLQAHWGPLLGRLGSSVGVYFPVCHRLADTLPQRLPGYQHACVRLPQEAQLGPDSAALLAAVVSFKLHGDFRCGI